MLIQTEKQPEQPRKARRSRTIRVCKAAVQKTFAEQFSEIAPAYARRTLRQDKTLGEIAFGLSVRN